MEAANGCCSKIFFQSGCGDHGVRGACQTYSTFIIFSKMFIACEPQGSGEPLPLTVHPEQRRLPELGHLCGERRDHRLKTSHGCYTINLEYPVRYAWRLLSPAFKAPFENILPHFLQEGSLDYWVPKAVHGTSISCFFLHGTFHEFHLPSEVQHHACWRNERAGDTQSFGWQSPA